MGDSKTICYCNSEQCKSLSGKTNKSSLLMARKQICDNLELYLSEEPCVGCAAEDLPISEDVKKLADLYVACVLALRASQQDRTSPKSLAVSAMIADVFAALWQQCASIRFGTDSHRVPQAAIPNARQYEAAIVALGDVSVAEGDPDDVGKASRLLADGYAHAVGELTFVAKDANPSIVMHHMAIVGDILEEMLHLVLRLNPDRVTEDRLPEDHPHAIRARERTASASE